MSHILSEIPVPYQWQVLGSLRLAPGFIPGPTFSALPAKTPAPAGRQNIYFAPSNFDGSLVVPCIVSGPTLQLFVVGCPHVWKCHAVCRPITHNTHRRRCSNYRGHLPACVGQRFNVKYGKSTPRIILQRLILFQWIAKNCPKYKMILMSQENVKSFWYVHQHRRKNSAVTRKIWQLFQDPMIV